MLDIMSRLPNTLSYKLQSTRKGIPMMIPSHLSSPLNFGFKTSDPNRFSTQEPSPEERLNALTTKLNSETAETIGDIFRTYSAVDKNSPSGKIALTRASTALARVSTMASSVRQYIDDKLKPNNQA